MLYIILEIYFRNVNILYYRIYFLNVKGSVVLSSKATLRQVPRPTSFGKWGGGPMVLKVGNFSSQACTDQNSCGIGNCGTDLDFRTSHLAPCIAELRFHPPSAELELNLSRPQCAPGAPPVRPQPSISLQH